MVLEQLVKDKDDIVSLYKSGLLQKEIAKIYNTSETSIARVLRSQGITSKVAVSTLDECNIVEEYKNGMTVRDIATKFNIGEKRVSNILKKYNVQILLSCERQSKYSLDEHYFDDINHQDKAYILGFLYADGCNCNNNISICLQERDRSILDKINIAIGSNRPLRFIDYSNRGTNCQNQYSLNVTNKYLSDKLAQLGMVQNKSLILEFPVWLNRDLYPHFIRGYFDGDGYVSKNYYNAKLSIVSTKNFCEKVRAILYKNVGINSSIYLCHKNELTSTRTLQISGRNQIRKFLDYIYDGANLYLQRKYDVYQSLYTDHKNMNNTLIV